MADEDLEASVIRALGDTDRTCQLPASPALLAARRS
jgi:hypothetical protein